MLLQREKERGIQKKIAREYKSSNIKAINTNATISLSSPPPSFDFDEDDNINIEQQQHNHNNNNNNNKPKQNNNKSFVIEFESRIYKCFFLCDETTPIKCYPNLIHEFGFV